MTATDVMEAEPMPEEGAELVLREHREVMPTVSGPNAVQRLPETASVTHAGLDILQVDQFFGAGDLQLTKKQQDALTAPIDEDDIDILPTGEIYYAQDQYRHRLNQALGVGQWSLRPIDGWSKQGKTVVREYALMINGKFAATGLGEADYIESNSRSSWATACESAKSIALRRACKDVGVALECWNKRFAEAWKSKHAAYIDGKWKRRESSFDTQKGAGAPSSNPTGPIEGKTSYPSAATPSASPAPAPVAFSGQSFPTTIRVTSVGATSENAFTKKPQARVGDDKGRTWYAHGLGSIAVCKASQEDNKAIDIDGDMKESKGKSYYNIKTATFNTEG